MLRKFFLISIVLGTCSSCGIDPVAILEDDVRNIDYIPEDFPAVEFPEGNELTPERWELGKKLFYDPIMSQDLSTSCASCHHSDAGFADDSSFSEGFDGLLTSRNSPSLFNVAYHPYFMREGAVPTLEQQILVPIQEHNEFNNNILTIAERLNESQEYIEMSLAAYNRTPDAFVITRSIACFERTLISGDSPYDLHQREEADMSEASIRGMNLFFGKANCSSCHGGFNFTNYAFENNGLYEVYEDDGRYRLTLEEEDRAKFKVPSLRNVALTSPYMHDGSFGSLSEILDHYNSGGMAHPNKSSLIQALDLSNTELDDLEEFLRNLSDPKSVMNKLFQDED